MTGIQGWGQGLQSNVLQRQAAPAHTQVSLCTFLQNRDLLPRNEKDLQQFALRMYRKSFRVSEFDDSSPATFSNRSAFLRNLHDEWWQDIKKLVNLLYNQCRWVKNGFSNSSYTRNGSFTNDERLSSNPRWAPATDVPCNKGKSTLNSKKTMISAESHDLQLETTGLARKSSCNKFCFLMCPLWAILPYIFRNGA